MKRSLSIIAVYACVLHFCGCASLFFSSPKPKPFLAEGPRRTVSCSGRVLWRGCLGHGDDRVHGSWTVAQDSTWAILDVEKDGGTYQWNGDTVVRVSAFSDSAKEHYVWRFIHDSASWSMADICFDSEPPQYSIAWPIQIFETTDSTRAVANCAYAAYAFELRKQ